MIMVVKNDITFDISCLWEALMVSDEIGKTKKGGLRRLVLSDDDVRIRQILLTGAGMQEHHQNKFCGQYFCRTCAV